MNIVPKIKYAWFTGILLLFSNIMFAQTKIKSFDLFERETDMTNVTKINNNLNELLLIEENMEELPYFFVMQIKDSSILLDSVENIKIAYIRDTDTVHYNPLIRANSLFYTKDTLFLSFGRGLAIYTKKEEHFKISKIISFDENDDFSNIIGYKNGVLVLGNQYYRNKKHYDLALYDINSNTFLNKDIINTGNSILLNYYDNFNMFASNNKYISVINTIKPIVLLYDYNLNLIDSINFAFNNDYLKTQHILDTNVFVNQSLIDIKHPKNIMYFLDKINILKYTTYVRQSFIKDDNLLICSWEGDREICNLIEVNVNTKNKKILLSFPLWSNEESFNALNKGTVMSLFSNGIFTNNNTKLTENEENIIYTLDMYYSNQLDFSTTDK